MAVTTERSPLPDLFDFGRPNGAILMELIGCEDVAAGELLIDAAIDVTGDPELADKPSALAALNDWMGHENYADTDARRLAREYVMSAVRRAWHRRNPNPEGTEPMATTKAKRKPKTSRPNGVPETQDEAAAKEAAVDVPVSVPTGIGKLSIKPQRRDPDATVSESAPPVAASDPDAGSVIELDAIERDEANPRREFDQAKLQALAESLKAIGQLQDIIVRPKTAGGRNRGRYVIVIGERRWRAAKLAGMTTIRCQVRDVAGGELVWMRGAENDDRADFNAIEKAIWYQQMVEAFGDLSQRQLAAKMNISQGDLSNTLRLLKLPEAWQARVISGEITAAHARDLATWADVDGLLSKLEAIVVRDGIDHVRAEWSQALWWAIEDVTRPYRGNYTSDGAEYRAGWGYPRVARKLGDDEKRQLDVRTVSIDGEKEDRCFNVPLWDQWAEEDRLAAEAKARKKQDRDDQAAAGGSAANGKRTPAEQKRLREQQAAQHHKRLYRWVIGWKQKHVVEGLAQLPDGDPIVQKWLLWYATTHHSQMFRNETLRKASRSKKHATEDIVRSLDEASALAVGRECLRIWAAGKFDGYNVDVHPLVIEGMFDDLGCDAATLFKADDEFLGLHNRDQLLELCGEWQVTVDESKLKTKKSVVAMLLKQIDTPRGLPMPKRLVKLKPVSLA